MTKSLNSNGKLIKFEIPKVMGILNTTPDSFYDGGQYLTERSIDTRIHKMIDDGVDIIDVGGMSTRPGAKWVEHEEEWERIEPALKLIRHIDKEILISVDTVHSQTIVKALDYEINIINDISGGGHDEHMVTTAVDNQLPLVVMHIPSSADALHIKPNYENATLELYQYFNQKVKEYKIQGLTDVIIDPGFGFGKTVEENYELLDNLDTFQLINQPILVGISRKSMIYKFLEIDVNDSLSATSALHLQALQKGADLLRVHDVKEAKECISLYQKLNQR